jgi:hypothetical protein
MMKAVEYGCRGFVPGDKVLYSRNIVQVLIPSYFNLRRRDKLKEMA